MPTRSSFSRGADSDRRLSRYDSELNCTVPMELYCTHVDARVFCIRTDVTRWSLASCSDRHSVVLRPQSCLRTWRPLH